MEHKYTEDELNKLDKQALIMLFLSMQDRLKELKQHQPPC